MVEPQAMSLRTQNSCVGMPRRRATSLRQIKLFPCDVCPPKQHSPLPGRAGQAGNRAALLTLPRHRQACSQQAMHGKQGCDRAACGPAAAPEERSGNCIGGIALIHVVLEHQAPVELRLVVRLMLVRCAPASTHTLTDAASRPALPLPPSRPGPSVCHSAQQACMRWTTMHIPFWRKITT